MSSKKSTFHEKNQNKVFAFGFLLILAVIGWSLIRPLALRNTQKEKEEAKTNEEILKAPMISLKEFLEKIKNNEKIFVIDLRSSDEFSRGHIAGAINVPSGKDLASQLGLLGAEKTSLLVVLNSGDDVLETAKITNVLVSGGFVNAKYLRGGISDWKKEGYTLISGGKSPEDQNKIKKISVAKIAEELSGGDEMVQFVDVREKSKFSLGHIPKAINLPLSTLEKDHEDISLVKKVIVYEEDEEMANKAAVILFDLNFFNVFVLDGGLSSWRENDGKLVAD